MEEINKDALNCIYHLSHNELIHQLKLDLWRELGLDLRSELGIEIGDLKFDFIQPNINI